MNKAGSEQGCFRPLQMGTLLIKTYFLPRKSLCYACTWQRHAAGPQAAWLYEDGYRCCPPSASDWYQDLEDRDQFEITRGSPAFVGNVKGRLLKESCP